MRRALLLGVSVLVLCTGGLMLLLRTDDRAPLPTREELRAQGFAVWPEDTVDEGMNACEEPASWRLDPKQTAFQFAREVLRYPDPDLNTGPITDEESSTQELRYLVGSNDVGGVFLGSVIDVRKYDRCWFVVGLEPREGGALPPIGYLHGDDGTRLAVRMEGAQVEIGYGSWQTELAAQRGQVVLSPPALEPDATGHVIALAPFKNVLDGSAAPLGSVPEAATTSATRIGLRRIVETPRTCEDDNYHRPERALADLFTFTLGSGVSSRGSKLLFDHGDGAEQVEGDRWSLRVDGVPLTARIPKLAGGCRRILLIDANGPSLLTSLHAAPGRFTFEVNWGKARSADISLISASGRGGSITSGFERVDGPITLPNQHPLPSNEPFYVTLVLRTGGDVVSAERSWFRAP